MNFEFGYDAQGIENLLEEIRGYVILKAGKDAVEQLSIIYGACDKNWVGESEVKFKNRLKTDAENFKEALRRLYNAFEIEIANAGSSFQQFDKNLFE